MVFKIFVKVGDNKILNTNAVTMTVKVTCSEETLGDFYISKTGLAFAFDSFLSSSTYEMIFRVPKLETGTKSMTLKLSDLIERKIDYLYCGPKSFTGYTDSSLTTMTTSSSPIRPQ